MKSARNTKNYTVTEALRLILDANRRETQSAKISGDQDATTPENKGELLLDVFEVIDVSNERSFILQAQTTSTKKYFYDPQWFIDTIDYSFKKNDRFYGIVFNGRVQPLALMIYDSPVLIHGRFREGNSGTVVSSIELAKDKITMTVDEEDNGGLIKIQELTDKLNDLNDKYNDLVNRLLAWTPVAQDGGLALKTALTVPTPISTNTSFNKADYENTKITH
jgi:hypothetical protein